MNTKYPSISNSDLSQTQKPCTRFLWLRQVACALVAAWIAISLGTARAGNEIWDANADGSLLDGSGTWHGGNTWWTGTADQAWTNGGHAIIGFTNSGTYSLVLDTPVTTGVITFKTNNYTLSGATP
jgi:hypothetical protein